MATYLGYSFIIVTALAILSSYFVFNFVPSHFDKWANNCESYRNTLENRLERHSKLCSAIRRQLSLFQDFKSRRYHNLYESAIESWLIAQKGQHQANSRLALCVFPVYIPSGLSRNIYIRFIGHAMYALISGYCRLKLIDRQLTKHLESSIKLSVEIYKSLKYVPSQLSKDCEMILDQRIPYLESIVSDPKNIDFLFFEQNQELIKLRKTFNTIQYYLEKTPDRNRVDQLGQKFESAEPRLLALEARLTSEKERSRVTISAIEQVGKESSEIVGFISQQGLLEEFAPIILQASTSLSEAVQLRRLGRFREAQTKIKLSQMMINLSLALAETQDVISYLSQVKEVSLLDSKRITEVTNQYQSVFSQASISMTKGNIDGFQKIISETAKEAKKLKEKHNKKIRQLEKKAERSLRQIEKEWRTIKQRASLANDPLIGESMTLTLRYSSVQSKPVLLIQYNKQVKAYSERLRIFHKQLKTHIDKTNSTLEELLGLRGQAQEYSRDWACLTYLANQIVAVVQKAEFIAIQLPKQNTYNQIEISLSRLNQILIEAKQRFSEMQNIQENLNQKREYLTVFIKLLNQDFANDRSVKLKSDLIYRGLQTARRESSLQEAHEQLKNTFLFAISIVSHKSLSGKYIMLIQSGAIVNGVVQGDNAKLRQFINDLQ